MDTRLNHTKHSQPVKTRQPCKHVTTQRCQLVVVQTPVATINQQYSSSSCSHTLQCRSYNCSRLVSPENSPSLSTVSLLLSRNLVVELPSVFCASRFTLFLFFPDSQVLQTGQSRKRPAAERGQLVAKQSPVAVSGHQCPMLALPS
jgi:hypothetical protein